MVDESIFLRAHNLIQEWRGKENYNVPAHVITEIFITHNQVFPNAQEHSRACGACRQRTWNRLKTWYDENKHLYGY